MSTLWTNGFNSKGNEMMANGMTGKPFQSLIFSGPCYYQVLKHYVKHKMQVRSRGVKNALTQQPIPGRARGGAIKFEEMIRDACVSHGVANVLREKFEHSDASRQIVCVNCKYLSSTANVNAKCRNCGEASYANVSMPYSAKLLINQLAAAGIMIMTATQPLEKPNTDFITKNPIP
jgi:DNA-directed RNA polymerase beta subunit